MKQMLILFLATFSSYFIHGQNQLPPRITILDPSNIPDCNSIKYKIDPAIDDSVIKKVKVNLKPNYQLMTLGENENTKEDMESEVYAFVTYAAKDTLNIMIVPRQSASLGFRIIILGDSCKIFHFALGFDDGGVLKLNRNDTTYRSELLVKPTFCKLILTKRPDFRIDEPIEGYIEFESRPYFFKHGEINGKSAPDGHTQAYLKGYFKAVDMQALRKH